MKKYIILTGLLVSVALIYRACKRKSVCLDLIKAVPDMIEPVSPSSIVPDNKQHAQGLPKIKGSKIETSFMNESGERIIEPLSPERLYYKGLVQEWLAKHPEVSRSTYSNRRGAIGKYSPTFNRMRVGDIVQFANVDKEIIERIRASAFKFSMRYNVDIRVEKTAKDRCKAIRMK